MPLRSSRKIREIESEFSKIGVRMTQLRPIEVFRKFLSKNRFEFQVEKWELGQTGAGGKIPARTPMSTGMSTGSPGCRLPCRQPCRQGVARQFCLAHHFDLGLVLWLGSGEFRNLMDLIQLGFNPMV